MIKSRLKRLQSYIIRLDKLSRAKDLIARKEYGIAIEILRECLPYVLSFAEIAKIGRLIVHCRRRLLDAQDLAGYGLGYWCRGVKISFAQYMIIIGKTKGKQNE